MQHNLFFFNIFKWAIYRPFFLLLLLTACGPDSAKLNTHEWININEHPKEVEVSLNLISGKESYNFTHVKGTTYSRIVVLNSTAWDFLYQLNGGDGVQAISGWEDFKTFYPNTQGEIQSIPTNGAISLEQLLAFKPDLIVLNPYQYQQFEKLEKFTKVLVMADYLLPDFTHRLRYFEVFGHLLNQYEEGVDLKNEAIYTLENLPKVSLPLILQLEQYSGNYFIPSCASPWASFLNQTTVSFMCSTSEIGKSVSKEQALSNLQQVQLLLVLDWDPQRVQPHEIIQNFNLNIPQSMDVIYCNATNTPYFLYLSARPQVLLKDFYEVVRTKSKGVFFEYF